MNSTTPQSSELLESFLATLAGQVSADAKSLCRLMEECTGEPPVLWGKNIVGFGKYHYKYSSGREGESMLIGFSPRAKAYSLYMSNGFSEYPEMLTRLGKHSRAVSCLYIKKLSDIDFAVLREILMASIAHAKSLDRV